MAEQKFEQALAKLEGIVGQMEDENIGLDEALRKFEEGIRLVRFCKAKLEKAEKKIEILLRDEDGSLRREDFEPEKSAELAGPFSPGRAAKPRAAKAPVEEPDDDLLF